MTVKILELGCGARPTPGAVHHDRISHAPYVDVAHDLNSLPWPWSDDEFDQVIALDVMEHLKLDVAEWLDELWRIIKPGGEIRLRLPAWDNPVSYRDPTHYRVFHDETFYYWQPDPPCMRTMAATTLRRPGGGGMYRLSYAAMPTHAMG